LESRIEAPAESFPPEAMSLRPSPLKSAETAWVMKPIPESPLSAAENFIAEAVDGTTSRAMSPTNAATTRPFDIPGSRI